MVIKSFEASGDSLDGVILYLYNSFNKNYDTYVSVKSSSTIYIDDWREEALIIPTRNSTSSIDNWASFDVEKSNFTIYFHKHVVDITHYSFRSQSNHPYDHPKSWVVEGSLDGKNWEIIDEEKDRTELCGIGKLKTFEVGHKGKYSYFKFTQTEPNNFNRHCFDLGKVEFFGALYTKYSFLNVPSLYCRRKTSSFLIFISSISTAMK